MSSCARLATLPRRLFMFVKTADDGEDVVILTGPPPRVGRAASGVDNICAAKDMLKARALLTDVLLCSVC